MLRDVRSSLEPVTPNRLVDRLTALGMMMAPNRPPAEATIWLREMTRLLGDLPEDIVNDAIDGVIKTCKFLPTCAEIREVAESALADRKRLAAQIEATLRLSESGVEVPPYTRFNPDTCAHEQPEISEEEREEVKRLMAELVKKLAA